MAKLKHIAIATRDVEGTAKFYNEVLGLKIVGRDDVGHTAAVFLTDGDVNVTLLYFRTDEAALHQEGLRFVGLHHVGFVMNDKAEYDAVLRKLQDRNALFLQGGPVDGPGTYFEVKSKDPNGITFDVSMEGWPGISINRTENP
jgi:methylmalonyl-CoA/ethylmalonyl-CoA epimerase